MTFKLTRLLTTGRNAFQDINSYGWGTFTLKLNFSVPAVPEPGSHALACAGVLMVVGARRRARRSRRTA